MEGDAAMKLLHAFMMLLVLSAPALALTPDEMLPDAAQESRARILSKELRCPVCQGQDIDDSAAVLARDLRLLVRARIAAGDTDAQVLDFISARYGDFILMKPRVKEKTLPLWLLPFAALGAGFFAVIAFIRKSQREGS
jgi:cytochrome c-type biogenesis protein CcmH